MDVEARPRRASRACLIGNAVRQRMLCAKKTRSGYGTRSHDWELDELESMKTLSLSVYLRLTLQQVTCCYIVQPIVADHHE